VCFASGTMVDYQYEFEVRTKTIELVFAASPLSNGEHVLHECGRYEFEVRTKTIELVLS
jgi:hypothetical protein